ncbi:hypothetical protein BDF14DRAFT_1844585 [Spinellus fusiger]|nr:hypothetical protein BDF14DRAFT_1844585 [Spinellus fusiger]
MSEIITQNLCKIRRFFICLLLSSASVSMVVAVVSEGLGSILFNYTFYFLFYFGRYPSFKRVKAF